MTNEEAREILKQIRTQKCVSECDYGCKLYESETFCLEEKALDMAIKALEQQPCDDSIRKLVREFDDKHPALFADYMQEFNNHPISEIIEYMWDMHDLIEDIKYRLPQAESEE